MYWIVYDLNDFNIQIRGGIEYDYGLRDDSKSKFYLYNDLDSSFLHILTDLDYDFISNIISNGLLGNYYEDENNKFIVAVDRGMLFSGSSTSKLFRDNVKLRLMGASPKEVDYFIKDFKYSKGVLYKDIYTFRCIDFGKWCSSKILRYDVYHLKRFLNKMYFRNKDNDEHYDKMPVLFDNDYIQELPLISNSLGGFSMLQEISINDEWYFVFTSDKLFVYVPSFDIFNKSRYRFVRR